jgi:Na+(H+)/acetate symporter ActP
MRTVNCGGHDTLVYVQRSFWLMTLRAHVLVIGRLDRSDKTVGSPIASSGLLSLCIEFVIVWLVSLKPKSLCAKALKSFCSNNLERIRIQC